MRAKQFNQLLIELNACPEAVEFCKGKTFKKAWSTCDRGDWMLWLSKNMQDQKGWCDLRNLTLAKARCAKLVIHLMKDERSKKAVLVAEKFGNNKATKKQLDAYADAAYAVAYAGADATAVAADADADAAYAAYAADATYAAYAAADADAADAAYAVAAAYAAYAAAYAAAAAAAYAAAAAGAAGAADAAGAAYAAYAAADADATYAKKEMLQKCADICRETLNVPL